MSHKSEKRKLRRAIGIRETIYGPTPAIKHVTAPDFDDFERRAARHEELRYRIGPDCRVMLQFNGIATQEAIRKLIQYLEMGISDFPSLAEKSTPV